MKRLILSILALAFQTLAAEPIRFLTVDVFIDPKGQPLAAYQLEIKSEAGVKIVGVEGGEHPEFKKAPYYDPKALQGGRLVVAALSTAAENKLPQSIVRVLTLHLQSAGVSDPKLKSVLTVAVKLNAQRIPSEITLIERKQ